MPTHFLSARKLFAAALLIAVHLAATSTRAQTGSFTVQVGPPAPAPQTLVRHSDSWRFHKGTSPPQTNWQTLPDASLDSTWATGAGGFGYSDNAPETQLCQTLLTDMQDGYSTFYIRKSFQIGTSIDPAFRLVLRMDWDDGFVAYLDGAEIQRAVTRTAVGVEPLHISTAQMSHESSLGSGGNAPVVYDLGAVGSRLSSGTHVFSVMGLNQASNSSDFVLIADLTANHGLSGGIVNNGLYALTSSNSLVLTGSNTIAGSSRVVVNGDDALFHPSEVIWTKVQSFVPGHNRLFIASLDGSGNILSSLTQDVIYASATLPVAGTLGTNTFWTNANEVILVTNNVVVATNATLTIGAGVVVIVSPNIAITAGAGGSIDIQGVEGDKVFFLPSTTKMWNELAADGTNSFLTIRHADVSRGAVKFRDDATGLMEDTYVHEFKNGTTPIAGCTRAASVTVRRCHFSVYHETLWQNTPMVVEDSLFENADNLNSDALDFDGAPPGSVIRRCTFRFGTNTNTDAIDIGSDSSATLIENCLMHDFPNDKGVSIGENSFAITIRNCVMYGNDSGVAVKDSCTAIIENCTIANCAFGFKNFNKANPAALTGGGHITNSANNILWNNGTNISLLNRSTLTADHSDFGNTNWPGEGNISADPLFENEAMHDYRLSAGSPARGTGRGGTNMGAILPVGGIPSGPFHLGVTESLTTFLSLHWREEADNEAGFAIERSTNLAQWVTVATVGPDATNFHDTAGSPGQKYYYRVRAMNSSGMSPFSNLASGTRVSPTDTDGDGLPDDWEMAHGLNPLVIEANLDRDSDGLSNLGEYLAGTDPRDAASRLWLQVQTPLPLQINVQFLAGANRNYTIQQRQNVPSGSWERLHDIFAMPTDRLITFTNSSAQASTFFRVVTPPQP